MTPVDGKTYASWRAPDCSVFAERSVWSIESGCAEIRARTGAASLRGEYAGSVCRCVTRIVDTNPSPSRRARERRVEPEPERAAASELHRAPGGAGAAASSRHRSISIVIAVQAGDPAFWRD